MRRWLTEAERDAIRKADEKEEAAEREAAKVPYEHDPNLYPTERDSMWSNRLEDQS